MADDVNEKLVIEGNLEYDEVYHEGDESHYWRYYLEDGPNSEINFAGRILSFLEDLSYGRNSPKIRITVEIID